MSDVFVPAGGAGRLPIQACSRMPAPERGFGFQKGAYHHLTPLELGTAHQQSADAPSAPQILVLVPLFDVGELVAQERHALLARRLVGPLFEKDVLALGEGLGTDGPGCGCGGGVGVDAHAVEGRGVHALQPP